MRWLGLLLIFVAALTIGSDCTRAQTVRGFPCVGTLGSSTCTDGMTAGLRGNISTAISYASAAGHNTAGDGGGGDFVKLGVASAVCNSYSSGISGTANVGDSTISALGGTGFLIGSLAVGELVAGSGTDSFGNSIIVQSGTEIASIDTSHSNIALTLPLAGTSTVTTGVSMNVTLTGDNNGTLIVDSVTGGSGPQCWQKTNYRGDPHEFGAYGDSDAAGTRPSAHDDTTVIQYWLGAYGNFNAGYSPSKTPPNFGPWIASIPANYKVSTPLYCPPNATIMGTENLQNGGIPRTNFVAAPGFSGYSYPFVTNTITPLPTIFYGSQAVFAASAYCRLSGVAVTGNGFALSTPGSTHVSTTIDNLGSLAGIALGDAVVGDPTIGDIPAGTVVTQINTSCSPTCSVTVSQATTGSGTSGEAISFYGPDAVDILGRHVTIDGFSYLTQGLNNISCIIPTTQPTDALQIKDTIADHSILDNLNLGGPCGNVRMMGDIVDHAGNFTNQLGATVNNPDARGVVFGPVEGLIANSIIEESQGIGIDIEHASAISITGADIQGNGQGIHGGVGVYMNHANAISICGNHFEGNGGNDAAAVSAHIYFADSLDDVNLCGNVYTAQSLDDVALRPDFVYDALATASLTNIHIYDAPAPQASGQVYSTNAALLLPQVQVPRVPLGHIGGLTMSNNALTAINVAPGESSDSTNSATIVLPPESGTPTIGCTVDLAATNGPGGLDNGSAAASTTYFYFLIGSASGGNPACMASTGLTPTFKNAPSYQTTFQASTYYGLTYNGHPQLYNMSSVAGLSAGQTVKGSVLGSSTTIVSVGTLTNYAAADIASTGAGTATVTLHAPATTTSIGPGMTISDAFQFATCGGGNSAQNLLPADGPWVVTGISSSTVFSIASHDNKGTSSPMNDCIVVSGGNAAAILASPGTSTGSNFTAYTGLYRLIGALYSTSSTSPKGTMIPFIQDDNTFYLASPTPDIISGFASLCGLAGGPTAISCALSVPCGRTVATCSSPGLQVEAFGRLVGGTGDILLSSLDQQSMPPPNGFGATPPGYSTTSVSASSSHPFRLFTNSSGEVRVQGTGTGNSVKEDTDGWVLHR